jgi:hypothetical protein
MTIFAIVVCVLLVAVIYELEYLTRQFASLFKIMGVVESTSPHFSVFSMQEVQTAIEDFHKAKREWDGAFHALGPKGEGDLKVLERWWNAAEEERITRERLHRMKQANIAARNGEDIQQLADEFFKWNDSRFNEKLRNIDDCRKKYEQGQF